MAYERFAQELIDEFHYTNEFNASIIVEALREMGEDITADLVEAMNDRIEELEARLNIQK